MTTQQKHACSMSLKNWSDANHLKVIWSPILPKNFWTFEACRSFAGTAVLCRQQDVKAVAALKCLCGICLVSLHRGIGVRSAILAQTCCHHWSQWPGAPAAAATQCTLSSAKNREHSQPAWDHCSALLSMPAQGIEPKMLHFQMAPEELGPLQPSPEMDF